MILQKVFQTLDQLLPPETNTIVVGVSGGADSMALTLLANEYANLKGYTLKAVTVDHRLRPESEAEATWVQQTLQGQGICHQTLVWQHEADINRCHERARAARYQLLLDFCKDHPNSALLTAHHQQDQVETILMRFLHGSGPAGFGGIQRLRFQAGVAIVRPLLNISPQELRAYLKVKDITWVEDPSNTNMKYERTRVRQLLECITNDWGYDGILASAAKIYEMQSALDEIIDGYEASFVITNHMDPRLREDDKKRSEDDREGNIMDPRLREDDKEIFIPAAPYCHSRAPLCHSRVGGNLSLCIMDPRLCGDDKKRSVDDRQELPSPVVIPALPFVIPALPFVIPALPVVIPASPIVIPAQAGIHPLPLSFPRRRESILPEVIIDQTVFFKCPEQVQRQWLRKQIWQIGGATYPKPYKTINAILKMLKQPKVNGYKVAGCVINVSKRMLYINNSAASDRVLK